MKGEAHNVRRKMEQQHGKRVARYMSSEDVYALLLLEKELINVLN